MALRDAFSVACAFAQALDRDDFGLARSLLASGCEYEGRTAALKGPEAIVASYIEASEWGRANLDKLEYTSVVQVQPGEVAAIRFSDHIAHAGLTHTYTCEQLLTVGADGKITRIRHVELPGEREQLLEFFARVGVSR